MAKRKKPSLTELANAAMERVADKVIERARSTKTPIVIAENGVVKKISARQAQARRKKVKG